MIVLSIIVVLIIAIMLLFIVGGILLLVHDLLTGNANYLYWCSRVRVQKITYGSGNVRFIAEKNKVWGLPFFWEIICDCSTFDRAYEEANRCLKAIANARIVKKQTIE